VATGEKPASPGQSGRDQDQFSGMGFGATAAAPAREASGARREGRRVGTLGLKSLGEMSYPGSSIPFEPVSIESGAGEEVWAALADGSGDDVGGGDVIATAYDSTNFLTSTSAKDRHHRYPQFTSGDMHRAVDEKLRKVHSAGRWIRLHESGESFEDQEAEELDGADAAAAADGSMPASQRFARDDRELRRKLQEAVAAGDDVTAEVIAKRLVPLGKETSAEEARALLAGEAEGLTHYHKRVARFVEAVYGSRDVESDDDLARVRAAALRRRPPRSAAVRRAPATLCVPRAFFEPPPPPAG